MDLVLHWCVVAAADARLFDVIVMCNDMAVVVFVVVVVRCRC